jgi:hypothetical protein
MATVAITIALGVVEVVMATAGWWTGWSAATVDIRWRFRS